MKINYNIYSLRVILFILVTSMYSCKKEQQLSYPIELSFANPDSLLQKYKEVLINSSFGWEYILDADDDGFFAGHFSLDNSTKGIIYVDDLLAFNTFNYEFKVIDKKPAFVLDAISQSEKSEILFSKIDSVYSILAVYGDTVVMSGNKYSNKIKLFPATKYQKDAYSSGGVQEQIDFVKLLNSQKRYFKNFKYNGVNYDFQFNTDWKQIYIHYGGLARYNFHESNYAYTSTGIILKDNLVEDANVFRYVRIKEENKSVLLNVNSEWVNISLSTSPTAYNPTAYYNLFMKPQRSFPINVGNGNLFFQKYYISKKGFTVDGVEDYYGIQTVPNYNQLHFYPIWLQNEYGAFRVLNSDGYLSDYGPAFSAAVNPIGVLFLNQVGEFDSLPVDLQPVLKPIFDNLFTDDGFWVIKSGPASYDLVSVNKPLQHWIRFE